MFIYIETPGCWVIVIYYSYCPTVLASGSIKLESVSDGSALELLSLLFAPQSPGEYTRFSRGFRQISQTNNIMRFDRHECDPDPCVLLPHACMCISLLRSRNIVTDRAQSNSSFFTFYVCSMASINRADPKQRYILEPPADIRNITLNVFCCYSQMYIICMSDFLSKVPKKWSII